MREIKFKYMKFETVKYNVNDIYVLPVFYYLFCQSKRKPSNNKTILLINEYYDDLLSFKNLNSGHYILFFCNIMFSVFVLWVILFKDKINHRESLMSYMLILMPMIIFIFIREIFDKRIIKNYNKKYHTYFLYIWQAQDDWLIRKFGKNYNSKDIFEHLDKWKSNRDKYSTHKSFSIRQYTYQSDAKPRINALIIAFLSLNAVILINASRPIDIEIFLNHAINNIFTIISLSIFIAIFFYLFVFCIKFILDFVFYIYDIFISKNSFSEEKYKKFMGLLAQKIEANLDQ